MKKKHLPLLAVFLLGFILSGFAFVQFALVPNLLAEGVVSGSGTQPTEVSAYPLSATAVDDPIDCGTAVSPIIGFDISQGQQPLDLSGFLTDLQNDGFTVGTIDLSNGVIPACVNVLLVQGLASNDRLTSAYTTADINLITSWVANGRGVMIFGDWGSLKNETQALTQAFGYTQGGGSDAAASDPTDADPAAPAIVGDTWIIYQSDNFSAHPALNGVGSIELLRSSWLLPGTGALVTTDADAGPANTAVIAANTYGQGCAILSADSNWVTEDDNAYRKEDNAQAARQMISWLNDCNTTVSPPADEFLFLPVINNNFCVDSSFFADIALTLDTSGSMDDPTEPGGPAKIEAARSAATDFLNLLTFPGDQAAVVLFAGNGVLAHPLSNDRAGLIAALQGSTPGKTRIDLALLTSRQELTSTRHIPANNQVIILLTDGHPNGTEETPVIAQANAAKAAGIIVYTIGLGNDTNVSLMQNIATTANHFYAAPSTSDLNEIYNQIADSLNCP